MSHKPIPQFDDPYLQKYFEKVARQDRRSEHIFRRILHVIERVIAAITILALMGALGIEMYHMFTTGGAYASFQEHCKGRVQPGMLADFVVLGADPFKVDPHTIKNIPVLATYLSGEKVYTAK